MSWTKSIFVVDHDVDVHDTAAVLRAAAEFCHPARDVERVRGPLDILDHAAPRLAAGTKFGLDCTRKVEGEQCGNAAPLNQPLRTPSQREGAGGGLPSDWAQEILARVRSLPGVIDAALHAGGWLIVSTNKTEPRQGWALAEALGAALTNDSAASPQTDTDVSFAIIVDASVDVHDPQMPFFHWLAHSDLGRDAWTFTYEVRSSIAFTSAGEVSPAPPQMQRDTPCALGVAGGNAPCTDESTHRMSHGKSASRTVSQAGDSRDSSNHHSILVVDATPKLPGDERHGEPVRRWPPLLSMPVEITRRAQALLGPERAGV